MMCKLRGLMDTGGRYDVKMKRWMQRGHYDVQIKSFDTYLEMMMCRLCE